ncbi:MAG: hypothetical protein ACR2QC_06185 [Gammaproteobacteria bacterium]
MKHFSAFLQIFSALGVFAVFAATPALAQEQQDAAAPVSPVSDAAPDAAGSSAANRPAMPRLFFTNEQRRILEVVRQEFITEENLEFAEFAPLLIEQQETVDVAEEEEFARDYDLRVEAFIRNRSSGDGRIWINNEPYPLRDESGVLQREGLDGLVLGSDGAISGMDSLNNSRFMVKVGQKLAGDGEVNETYPVIIVKKQ